MQRRHVGVKRPLPPRATKTRKNVNEKGEYRDVDTTNQARTPFIINVTMPAF